MRGKPRVVLLQALLLVCVGRSPAHAQQREQDPLPSLSEFGFQTLIDGAPSRSGFPDACPELRKHAQGRPWNEWTAQNLPDGCREALRTAVEPVERRSRFEIRSYMDIGTVGWDNNYSTVIPSLAGFHVSVADLHGWKIGAGGVLASFSPLFDLRSRTRRYQMSPRLNLFNLNRRVTELTRTRYDVYFSVEATREMFLPAESAQRTADGSNSFNNVFVGVSISGRSP